MQSLATLLQQQPQLKRVNALTSPPSASTGLTATVTKSQAQLCEECGGLGYIGYNVPVGHPKFGKVDKCPNPAHVSTRLTDRLSKLSEMHPDDYGLRLDAIARIAGNEAMLDACQKMLANPRGWLYLWGGPGNAKSIALRAMCNELMLRGFGPVVYIKFARLIEYVREAQAAQYAKSAYLQKNGHLDDFDSTYLNLYDNLLKIKVLALEEFDKARVTAFSQEFRFDFLDDRYEQGIRGETITMFAGQSHPSEFAELPLLSRLQSGKFIIAQNTAPDARGGEKWEAQ